MNIFKYTLHYGNNYKSLPRGTQFLSVQMQGGILTLWTLEPEDTDHTNRELLVCFTGEGADLHSYDIHIGTVQHNEIVYHVFELL